jgi:hypothetical protein
MDSDTACSTCSAPPSKNAISAGLKSIRSLQTRNSLRKVANCPLVAGGIFDRLKLSGMVDRIRVNLLHSIASDANFLAYALLPQQGNSGQYPG